MNVVSSGFAASFAKWLMVVRGYQFSALQSTFTRKLLTIRPAAHWQQHRQKIKTSAVRRAQILMRQASLEQKLQNAPKKLALRVSCSTAAVIFIMGVLRLWPMQRAKLVSASK